MLKKLFSPSETSTLASLALLALRVSFGWAMFTCHGLDKFKNFSSMADHFADPLGLGPKLSFSLVVFAEVAGALLVAVGFLTRFAALTLVIDMGVAFVMVHKTALTGTHNGELALLYLAAFTAILFAGPGKFSADRVFFKGQGKSKPKPSSKD